MAIPRIFISSTFYDLKHVREGLRNYIESLGYEAVLFEEGDILYKPKEKLDKSAYKEIENTQLVVFTLSSLNLA